MYAITYVPFTLYELFHFIDIQFLWRFLFHRWGRWGQVFLKKKRWLLNCVCLTWKPHYILHWPHCLLTPPRAFLGNYADGSDGKESVCNVGDLGLIPELGRSPGEGNSYPLVVHMVKNPPTMQETWIRALGWEDPLEEGMATHFNILAWRIPMDKGAWWATVHWVAESDRTE